MSSPRSARRESATAGEPRFAVMITEEHHQRLKLLKDIEDYFTATKGKRECVGCQQHTDRLLKLLLSNDDFECCVPVALCAQCAKQLPLPLKTFDYRWLWGAILVVAAVLFAIGKLWMASLSAIALAVYIARFLPGPKWVSVPGHREKFDELTGKVSYLCALKSLEKNLQVEVPPMKFMVTETEESPQKIISSSYQEFVRNPFWVTPAELAIADASPRFFQLLHINVDAILKTALNDPEIEDEAAAQIDFVILPGRRNEFEIQFSCRQGYRLAERLAQELRTLPGIPLKWPILLSFSRCRRKGVQQLKNFKEHYVVSEARRNSVKGGAFGSFAVKYFQLTNMRTLNPVTPDDCIAWIRRGNLPDDVALEFAQFLESENHQKEAIELVQNQSRLSPNNMNLLFFCVQGLYSQGQYERAAALCQQIIRQVPDFADAYGLLATLQQEMGRHEDAEQILLSAPKENRSIRFWLTFGRVALALDKISDAVEYAETALQMDAGNPHAWMLRAELRAHQEKYAEAIEDFEQVEKLEGVSINTTMSKVNLFRSMRRLDRAIEVLTLALQTLPDNPVLLSARAQLLIQVGKLELAREDCDTILRMAEDSGLALEIRAQVHLENQDPVSALNDLDQAAACGYHSSNTYFYRGLARLMLNEHEAAIEFLENAVEKNPDHLMARYHLARAYKLGHQMERAIAELDQVLAASPEMIDARIIRGFIHLENKEYSLAEQDFDLAMQQMPALLDPYRGLSVIHRVKGENRKALELLDKAVSLDAEDVGCRLERSQLLAEIGRLKDALTDLEFVLKSTPDFFAALLSRSQIRLQLGMIDEALRDFDEILKVHPDSILTLFGRSVILDRQGEADLAQQDVEAAISQSPENAQSIEMAYLLYKASTARVLEDYSDAIKAASEIIAIDPDHYNALRCRAGAYWYSECFVEALQDYTHLIELGEEADPASLNGRGQVYAELGEYELALKDLELAVETARKTSSSYLPYCLSGLGKTLTGLGRYDDAEAAFQESQTIQPDNAWLHFNRGLLHVAKNDHAAATSCFELALQLDNPRLNPRKRARAEAFIQKK